MNCSIRIQRRSVPSPAGLRQAERLPSPIFTPSTKAAVGDHDQNVSFDAMVATEQRASAAVAANPNVDHYNTLVSAISNFGRLSVRLKPRSERKLLHEYRIRGRE